MFIHMTEYCLFPVGVGWGGGVHAKMFSGCIICSYLTLSATKFGVKFRNLLVVIAKKAALCGNCQMLTHVSPTSAK